MFSVIARRRAGNSPAKFPSLRALPTARRGNPPTTKNGQNLFRQPENAFCIVVVSIYATLKLFLTSFHSLKIILGVEIHSVLYTICEIIVK
ncbi:MAG: hypothetical protein IKZ88_05645 [Neisseriaceae bacterium]|nr:hypothetical protein [Neisseriaceae bacterium]